MLQETASMMLVIGILLLLIEAVAFGFSLVILAAVGLASIIVGVSIKFQLLPDSLGTALGFTAILTAVITAIAWRPLKKLGGSAGLQSVPSDLVGYKFKLEHALVADRPYTHRYSGINWSVESATDLDTDTWVEVIGVEVGMFRVLPVAP